jgi:hypothetical protein
MAYMGKKKRGKPPLPPGQARDCWLHIRLTEGEAKALREMAVCEVPGMKLSRWARRKLMHGIADDLQPSRGVK